MLNLRIVRAVAWLELWGGVWGLIASALVIVRASGRVSLSLLAQTGLAVVFFVGSTIAGLSLDRNGTLGWKSSKALLVLQMIQVSLPNLSYAAYTGCVLSLSLHGWVIGLDAEIGSLFRLVTSDATQSSGVGVNIVAIAAFLVLVKARNQQYEPSGILARK